MREESAETRATASNNKWQRRSRKEWQIVFARFAKSGLEVEPFCVREGLSESTFRRWRSVLGDEVSPVVRPAAQQVPGLRGFVDAGTLKLGDSARLELRLELGDGVILHLSRS